MSRILMILRVDLIFFVPCISFTTSIYLGQPDLAGWSWLLSSVFSLRTHFQSHMRAPHGIPQSFLLCYIYIVSSCVIFLTSVPTLVHLCLVEPIMGG